MTDKSSNLNSILKTFGSVVVAYSGGVDSTFLLAAARLCLGKENVLAVTAVSETYTKTELLNAKKYARLLKVNHKVISTEEINDRSFSDNPPERCFFCKTELFKKLQSIAKQKGITHVIDGSNTDDLSDFRPGSKAKKKFGVRSPLQEAGFTKEDIRKQSKKMGLPTWDKPSCACLASRFPYGEKITKKKLQMVEKAEELLRKRGFKEIRVRSHGNIARIEIGKGEIFKLFKSDIMSNIAKKLKNLGYTYVTLDMEGFRSGSMNEVLKPSPPAPLPEGEGGPRRGG